MAGHDAPAAVVAGRGRFPLAAHERSTAWPQRLCRAHRAERSPYCVMNGLCASSPTKAPAGGHCQDNGAATGRLVSAPDAAYVSNAQTPH